MIYLERRLDFFADQVSIIIPGSDNRLDYQRQNTLVGQRTSPWLWRTFIYMARLGEASRAGARPGMAGQGRAWHGRTLFWWGRPCLIPSLLLRAPSPTKPSL